MAAREHDLAELLPESVRVSPDARALTSYGCPTTMHVVRLLAPLLADKNTDPPVVTVNTNYPGASPDVISSQITEPIESTITSALGAGWNVGVGAATVGFEADHVTVARHEYWRAMVESRRVEADESFSLFDPKRVPPT